MSVYECVCAHHLSDSVVTVSVLHLELSRGPPDTASAKRPDLSISIEIKAQARAKRHKTTSGRIISLINDDGPGPPDMKNAGLSKYAAAPLKILHHDVRNIYWQIWPYLMGQMGLC